MTEQKEASVLHRNNAMQYFTVNIKKGLKGFVIILLLCQTCMTLLYEFSSNGTQKLHLLEQEI